MSTFDSRSVASSTSWWILEKDRERKRSPKTIAIKLSKHQYNALIEISQQLRFMSCDVRWKDPKPWEVATALGGESVMVPCCLIWFGHLRLALIRMGVAEEESFYQSIVNAISVTCEYHRQSLLVKRLLKKALACSDPIASMEQRLNFLLFIHLAGGEFETLLRQEMIKIENKAHGCQEDADTSLARHFSLLNSSTASVCLSCAHTTKDNSKLIELKATSAIAQSMAKNLSNNEDLFNSEDEGKGFKMHLEKSFALIYEDMKSSSVEIDDLRVKDLVFLQDSNKQWTLNPLITSDIEHTLKQFIKDKGEELLL